MKNYNVRIDLNSVQYDVNATTKELAIERAIEKFNEETMYDVLKWATFEIEENE